MTQTNPLFDGTLAVTIGALDVTAAMLPGLGYSNTNPGGFGEATLRLPAASPWGTYNAAVVKGAEVVIEHDGTTLFEGEVTNDCTHATVEGGTAYYEVTAAGLWYKAGLRKDYCVVFADDDYGQWFELGTNAKAFQVDTDGKLEIRLEKGQKAKANKRCCLYYWLDGGMGNPDAAIGIIGFFGKNAYDVTGGNWYWEIHTSTSPWGTWTLLDQFSNGVSGADETWAWSPPAGTRVLRISLYSDADVTLTDDDRFITLTKLSLTTDYASPSKAITSITKASPAVVTVPSGHGVKTGDRIFIHSTDSEPSIDGWRTVATTPLTTTMTLVGVNVGTDPGTTGAIWSGVYPDTAMMNIACSTGLATAADWESAGIGNTLWGLAFRPHMSRAEAIETMAATYSAPIDYGFWESSTWYCHARAAAAGTHDILIDSSTPGIDFSVFKSAEDTPTHVKVIYTFRDVVDGTSAYPDGTLRAVYRPSAPTWTDASKVLDVWDQWADISLETGQANAIGDQILAWLDANAYAGTVTIATPTVPLRGGGTKNTAYIRAGDYIEDENLATGPLMITSMTMDVDSGVATLGIGETRAEFVARIKPRAQRDRTSEAYLTWWYYVGQYTGGVFPG